MPIIVDSREPKEIEFEINKLGIQTERKRLDSGDYVFGETAIERKTVKDFFSSLYDRRLYRQLFNLKDLYEKPKLAIIGQIPPQTKWIRIKKRRIEIQLTREEKDAKEKLMMNNWAIIDRSLSGVDVLKFDSNKQFVLYLIALFLNTNKKKRKYKPVKKKRETFPEIIEEMLTNIPAWGRVTAKRIAEEYPNLVFILEEKPKVLRKKLNKSQIKNFKKVMKGFTN